MDYLITSIVFDIKGMSGIKKICILIIALTFVLSSCSSASTASITVNSQANTQTSCSAASDEVLSPFTQFAKLKEGDTGFDSDQVDNIFRSYGIYDELFTKITNYNVPICTDIKVNEVNIGNKSAAVLLIQKGHLHIYVMFSYSNDKWAVDGFTYQNERFEPIYRIEKADDGTRYWLVVDHEANHGTGVHIDDEIWYNPDGTVAAEYPIEGYDLFFPQQIVPETAAYFSTSASYDGDSIISLNYSIRFVYYYKDNFKDEANYYESSSEFRPIISYGWEYDLKSQQFKYVSCYSDLPAGFSTMRHESSSEYGILQGFIDFYKERLGDKKITTLEEWEKFIDLE